MPDLVSLTIDDIEVSVPKGTLVVEAARQVGIEIPVFCYHPRLKPVGMCRMCLVEVGTPVVDRATGQVQKDEAGNPVIRWSPNPQVSCTLTVSPGMVVRTKTPAVAEARKAVLEFLLTSHPLDCPICDKGGECPLQELTFAYGPGVSRFPLEDKYHLAKKVPLGPLIVLDRERCILCARCIRFQEEIADDPVLGFYDRGRGMEIVTLSNPPFDSKFSGNTTDICPVGALTSRDFRFGARPWELTNVASICPHCSVGCNLALGVRADAIKRVMPRQNEAVNEIWICDKGRFGHHFVGAGDRLKKPLLRRDWLAEGTRGNSGELTPLVEVDWDTAFKVVASRLKAIKATHGPGAIGGLAGDRAANESLYLFQKLFRCVLDTNNVDHRPPAASRQPADDLIFRLGVVPGTNIGEPGRDTALFLIGADPEEEQPVLMLRLMRAARQSGATLIVANGRPTRMDRYARYSLRYSYGSEAYLVLGMCAAILEEGLESKTFLAARVDGFDTWCQSLEEYTPERVAEATGVPESDLRAAARAFAQAKNGVILFGREASSCAVTAALAGLALLTGQVGRAGNGLVALLPHNNSQGAADMGVLPDRLPGYAQVTDEAVRECLGSATDTVVSAVPGKGTAEMLEPGALKALYVMGADPAADYPASRAALEELGLLVVQDLFLTETARLADVVLPAAAFAEYEGTFTNTERRVQRFYPAVAAPGEARPDWWILTGLARELGYDWGYQVAGDVLAEIIRVVPIYAGVTEEALGLPRSQGRPPVSKIIYEGTRYEYLGDTGYQWPSRAGDPEARFELTWVEPDPILAPRDGELLLVPITRLYDRGTLISRSAILEPLIPQAHVLVSRVDAERLGLRSGDRVRVEFEGGSFETVMEVDGHAPAGVVLLPRNLGIAVGTWQPAPVKVKLSPL